MKKTAIALAAIIAASSSAVAADFTLYGKVDLGFGYNNVDMKNAGTTETFSLDSGNTAGSRFGLKGKEDLGNGYAVAFQLENGFSADTGALGQSGRLFGREARLSLITPAATISMGRMGGLTSGMGSYDLFQYIGDTNDGGWNYGFDCNNWIERDRYDNMVTVESADLQGFKAYAQYSFGTDAKGDSEGNNKFDDGVANERETQRYVAAGLVYDNGPLSLGLFYDSLLRKHTTASAPTDSQALSLAAAYDFEVAKVNVGFQYGWHEDMNFFTGSSDYVDEHSEDFEGYRLGVGASFPLPCGELTTGVYYGDVDNDEADLSAKNFNVVVGHTYPWSKRTHSYIGVAYKQAKLEHAGETQEKEKSFSAMLGLVHSF